MINVGIIGATGYAGNELVRILTGHKDAKIVWYGSRSYIDKKYAEVYQNMFQIVDDECLDDNMEELAEAVDVIFTATPQGLCGSLVNEEILNKVKIIDLSADFRIKDKNIYEEVYGTDHTASHLLEKAVYGQAEIYTKEIQKTSLIAGAGCYPTSIITPLYPLLESGLIDDNSFIIADSKSGVSGAGRKPSLTNIFCEANEDLKPYGIFSHRHNSEIDFILSEAQKNTHVIFTPHLLPVNRGILSTIYFKTKAGKDELENTIKEKYKGRYFVRIKNTIPAIRYVANTNFIDIAVYKKDDTAIIVSAIDNLLKGASGQAVQCFNIMQNIEETTGLI